MEQKHRDLLTNKLVYLVANLDLVATHLLDYLYTDGLLRDTDILQIEGKITTSEKNSHFLQSVLTRKGPQAFEKFIQALVAEGQDLIAAELDPDLTSRFRREADAYANRRKHGGKKTMLKDNHYDLVRNLDFGCSQLMDVLLSKRLLTQDNVEMLKNIAVSWKRSRYFLLEILPRRRQDALDNFIQALRETEGQEFIAEMLESYLAPADNVDQGRMPETLLNDDEIITMLSEAGNSAFNPLRSVTQKFVETSSQVAYEMSKKPRGRAVIIGNVSFLVKKSLDCVEDDMQQLEELFKGLYFLVEKHTSCPAKRIKEIVENEKRRDHSDYDAFILFILSHGENGCVLGEDEEPISVDMIVSTIGGCDTLRDKPKMFFFHTCRSVDASTSSNTASASNSSKHGVADSIIAYATLKGFDSYGKVQTGSWFVRFFVHVCSAQAQEEDLHGMLITVNRLLRKLPAAVKREQIGETNYSLRKKIYFFPNYPN